MNDRRNFSLRCQAAIIVRATVAGRVSCERCGLWCKSRAAFEIDHVLAEAMRPRLDRRRPLTPADGQLLCLACHDEKTRGDLGAIARAVRREAKALGAHKGDRQRKERPPLTKRVAGKPRIAREYGL